MVTDILQPTHLLFILIVALLVLGPKRLPEVARTLGNGLRDFRSAISGESHEDDPSRPGHYALGDTQSQYVTPHETKGDMPMPRETDEEPAKPPAEGATAGDQPPAEHPTNEDRSAEDRPLDPDPAESQPATEAAEPSTGLPPADAAPADTSPRVSPSGPERN